MGKKILENQTLIDEFKDSTIGKLDGEQIDLKKLEISKSVESEYRSIRNDVIVALYKRDFRYSEIANLKVQDIDKSFILITKRRGDSLFRVAISREISEKIKLLIKYKSDKDYVFTKNLIEKNPMSHTMITKIVKKHKATRTDYLEENKSTYTVERVCDKYFIYKKGQVIEGLILNTMTNALRICDILNADYLFK